MQAIKLKSVTKDYIWGGKKLYGWGFTPPHENSVIAEAWVLSFHKDGMSRVLGTDQPLCDAVTRQAWGSACDKFADFPVLVKLIARIIFPCKFTRPTIMRFCTRDNSVKPKCGMCWRAKRARANERYITPRVLFRCLRWRTAEISTAYRSCAATAIIFPQQARRKSAAMRTIF